MGPARSENMTIDDEEEWRASIEEENDEHALRMLTSWNYPQTDGFFYAPSGYKLHVRAVLPPEDPTCSRVRAVIIHCHGLNGHVNGKWFAGHYYPAIAAAGFAVFAVDIAGHGYSEGERALVEDWEVVLDDLESFAEALMGTADALLCDDRFKSGVHPQVLAHLQRLPLFVQGNSMGGMIGMYLGLRLQDNEGLCDRFKGAVLGCPALAVDLPSHSVQVVLRNVVVPLFKSHEMPAFLSSSSKSLSSWSYDLNDQMMREQAEMDIRDCAARFPDAGLGWQRNMRWGTAGAFSKLYSQIEDDMEAVEFPFLIIHDPGDKVCFISGSEKLMNLSSSDDKTLHRPNAGGLHCLPMAVTKEYVTTMANWIHARA
eukprot:TRINITY_DN25248_c0_g1_i1.p1 TRINITY_DN25248_c0_g1~~TRINITY_DN25248_c0_g1_i1.p1  ORF type:complete len:378 (+),score=38.65 TRINITY_DN25248_c0_g1_i1:27-1136(+)